MVVARVRVYCLMKMYTRAIELALEDENVELAISTLSTLESESDLQNHENFEQLWLMVIKHTLASNPTPKL